MLQPYVNQEHRLPIYRDGWWVISDTHWNHRRIEEYEPIRRTFGFDHNRVMIDRWRETVGEDDVIVHLGDLTFGTTDGFERIADELPGHKFLVLGNHDKRSKKWYRRHGFEPIPEFWLDYKGWQVRFSHYPDDEHKWIDDPRTLNVHGHVHSFTREDRRMLNVSAEVMGLQPVWVADLLDARITELTSALLDC